MKQPSLQMTDAQRSSTIAAVFCITLGVIYCIMTSLLPQAAVGMPNAPKVFPYALGFSLTGLGIGLLIQQILSIRQNSPKTEVKEKSETVTVDYHTKQILLTVANGVLYALLFKKLGYVLSTTLFLGLELFLFNGKGKWKVVLAVSVIFSLFIYILFNKLLGVYLPMMPVVGF